MGSKTDNRKLYPLFLTEAARVTQPGTGRAVLLSADKNCMKRVRANHSLKYWSSYQVLHHVICYQGIIDFTGLETGPTFLHVWNGKDFL